jgi:intein/homing endonuclease
MLFAAKEKDLEKPALYFFDKALNHIRTLPMMQRDKKKPEDVDSSGEDHCFVSSTEVMTDKGVKTLKSLIGKSGKILSVNGEYVNFHSVRKTRKNMRLVRVTFSDGHFVDCTPDHKFLTTGGMVEANDLQNKECIVSKGKGHLRDATYYYTNNGRKKLVYPLLNGYIKVESVKELNKQEDVYCLTAEGTHTFALKNGVIVSNCMDSMRYGLTRKAIRMKRRKVSF